MLPDTPAACTAMTYMAQTAKHAIDNMWLFCELSSPLFFSCHVILAGQIESRETRKIVVPVKAEYAVVAHPTTPKISPASSIKQAMHLFRHRAQIMNT